VSSVGETVAAIRAGELVVIPTDTVYGLACAPYHEKPVRALSELKGRVAGQPIALVAASLDWLFECVPELRGRAGVVARALLPGPCTLVFPNPARRYPWLTGDRPDTIGVRVPDVEGEAAGILEAVGAVAATSANRHGGTPPTNLETSQEQLGDDVDLYIDAGPCEVGAASTVVDFTADRPKVIRQAGFPPRS